jgi:hypothetical protein
MVVRACGAQDKASQNATHLQGTQGKNEGGRREDNRAPDHIFSFQMELH